MTSTRSRTSMPPHLFLGCAHRFDTRDGGRQTRCRNEAIAPMLEPRSSACRARQPGMAAMVLIGLFLVCFIGLAASTVTLLLLGSRLRFSFRPIGLLAGAGLSLLSGAIAGTLWRLPSGSVRAGEIVLFVPIGIVTLLRRRWNPIGQAFYGSLMAASLVYLAFAAQITFAGGLSAVATA